jgi:predicted nucleic acid-binding protein
MSAKILVDSNFYIDRARLGADPFAELAQADPDWDIMTCGMVTVEVLRGVKHPRVLERFTTAFSVMLFIASTSQVWERAWRLGWEMDRVGRVIPGPDLVIAAHALSAGAIVLTADHHFRQIPGLVVLNRLG